MQIAPIKYNKPRGIMKRLAAVAVLLCILAACDHRSQVLDHKPQCEDAGVQDQVIGAIAQQMDKVFALQDHMAEAEQQGLGRGYLAANPLRLQAIVQHGSGAGGALKCSASLQANLAGAVTQETFEQRVEATAYQVRTLAPLDPKFKEMSDLLDAATRLKPVAVGRGIAAWDIDYDVNLSSDGKQIVTGITGVSEIGSYLAYYAHDWGGAGRKAAQASSAAQSAPASATAPAETNADSRNPLSAVGSN